MKHISYKYKKHIVTDCSILPPYSVNKYISANVLIKKFLAEYKRAVLCKIILIDGITVLYYLGILEYNKKNVINKYLSLKII